MVTRPAVLEHLHLIDAGTAAAGEASAATIGFKAFNLLRMARLGVPVPPAFVLATALGQQQRPGEQGVAAPVRERLEAGIACLEAATGLGFGSSRRPLLVAVRSGSSVSMPGMLDTLLDIGLCDATVPGLLRLTGNPRLVWDSYRRLIQGYGEVVHGLESAHFDRVLADVLAEARASGPAQLDFRGLRALTHRLLEAFAERVGTVFPQSPQAQLEAATAAVFASWWGGRARSYRASRGIPDDLGTAVTVQQMVFGNAGATSGAGVGFTRDPATGAPGLYLDFAANAQGEDVVSGRCALGPAEALDARLPEVYEELLETAALLEREFRDAQEFEFTVQSARLYLLQTRTAKRSPLAALRIAVDLVDSGLLTPADGLARLHHIDLDAIGSWALEPGQDLVTLGSATPASAGVVTGRVALSIASALALARAAEPAILVRMDVATEDIAGIEAAAGVLSARGSRTAHAAVVARELGKACLVGCASLAIDLETRELRFGSRRLREGDWICLDADAGRVLAGSPRLALRRPTELLARVAGWVAPIST